MLDCISVENMRLSDAETIANFVPSLELMHRAAYGVFCAHSWRSPVAIVAGSGNNGGDGFALACILKEQGIACTVFTISTRFSQDSNYYAEKAKAAGVPVAAFTDGCLSGFATVVDCLLGTGFQGCVREDYRCAIEAINGSGAFVVSVDINSGMNGDSGEAELAVRSDLTVTIGFVKHGLVTENAGRYMKKLVCADIGIRLVREETKLCPQEEWQSLAGKPGYLPSPAWLDMAVIKAF